ncbi:DnaB-like helicase C-terminal domain-containing protein [Campylobacter sp.]|uniref:DnaB-like helicase C-terminal domain-containing protein n=1 Tax=Campylobacter sp. TaxID=205 RepID=UPI0029084F90|nr:DnaB-like helicase C-terminal domain-containing protein [Campylobacter sp.]MDU6827772.1 DnaB-like helicase C-terminal domain-containing protein [Campylobacter sp.]
MRDMNPENFNSVDEFILYLEDKRAAIDETLRDLKSTRVDEKFETMGEFVRRVEASDELVYFPTGLDWLDGELYYRGLAQGSFINIAGASYAGKTTFTIELLKGLAKSHKVAFFSYEMYEKVLIRKFKFAPFDILKNMTIIQDSPNIDIVCERIRKLSQAGVMVFAIDSRMKLRVSNTKLSEYEKNNEISSKLSELTRTLGIVIILINQISEADLKAGRQALKGSGDQVYDSDMIIYLSATLNDRQEVVKRELVMAKDRIGERTFKINIPDFYKKNEYGAVSAVEFRG